MLQSTNTAMQNSSTIFYATRGVATLLADSNLNLSERFESGASYHKRKRFKGCAVKT